MFDSKSDYALNKKDQDSIVYSGSDGHVTRITRADFSSEEEFLFWKSWSDADYKKPTMPIPTFTGTQWDLTPSGTTLVTSLLPRKRCYTKQSVKNRFRKPWSWFRGFQNPSQRYSSEDYGSIMFSLRMYAPSQKPKVLPIQASWQALHLLKEKL